MAEIDELQAIKVLLTKILALLVISHNRPDTKEKVAKELSKPST